MIPDDEFCYHGVIIGGNAVSLSNAAVNPDMCIFFRLSQMTQHTCGRQKIARRVFGIKAYFDGVTVNVQILLTARKRFSTSNTKLPFHQILSGDHFGDRMFHLEPGIHFHEIKGPVCRKQELDRSCTDIINGFGRSNGSLSHLLPQILGKSWSRSFFNNLLVPSLNRTITFKHVHCTVMLISKNLNFDMPWL